MLTHSLSDKVSSRPVSASAAGKNFEASISWCEFLNSASNVTSKRQPYGQYGCHESNFKLRWREWKFFKYGYFGLWKLSQTPDSSVVAPLFFFMISSLLCVFPIFSHKALVLATDIFFSFFFWTNGDYWPLVSGSMDNYELLQIRSMIINGHCYKSMVFDDKGRGYFWSSFSQRMICLNHWVELKGTKLSARSLQRSAKVDAPGCVNAAGRLRQKW